MKETYGEKYQFEFSRYRYSIKPADFNDNPPNWATFKIDIKINKSVNRLNYSLQTRLSKLNLLAYFYSTFTSYLCK